jgi:hypothetical protein
MWFLPRPAAAIHNVPSIPLLKVIQLNEDARALPSGLLESARRILPHWNKKLNINNLPKVGQQMSFEELDTPLSAPGKGEKMYP